MEKKPKRIEFIELKSDLDLSNERVKYRKLVVPFSMRSNYWKYFGFPSMDGKSFLTKQKVICTLCYTTLAYNKNTTNLKSHLIARHKDVYEKFVEEGGSGGIFSKSKLKKDKVIKPIVTIKELEPGEIIEKLELKDNCYMEQDEFLYTEELDESLQVTIGNGMTDVPSENYEEIELIDNSYEVTEIIKSTDFFDLTITKMIITDLLPPSIIDGVGFQTLIKTFCQFDQPINIDIERSIAKIYDENSNSVKSFIKDKLKDKHFSLALEKWTNIENQIYITVYINYLEQDKNIPADNNIIINEVVITKNDMKNIIVDVFKHEKELNWNEYFDDKITYLNMKMCTAVSCNFTDDNLKFYLDNKGISIVPCLLSILQNCIEKCFSLEIIDEIFEKIFDITENIFKITLFDRQFWLSKWKILTDYNELCTNHPENIYSDIDDTVKIIISCLNPLKISIDLLTSNANGNLSLIKPLVTQLLDIHFITDFDMDSDFIQEIKNLIRSELLFEQNDFLCVASFLDPRFKNLLKDEEITQARTIIKQKLPANQIIIDDKRIIMKINNEGKNSGGGNNSSSGGTEKQGLDYFFSNDSKPKLTIKNKFDIEIGKYMDEESPSLEQCPINWWNEFGYLFPNLTKMANIFINVPAHVNSRMNNSSLQNLISFQKKRYNLTENIEKLIFLNEFEYDIDIDK